MQAISGSHLVLSPVSIATVNLKYKENIKLCLVIVVLVLTLCVHFFCPSPTVICTTYLQTMFNIEYKTVVWFADQFSNGILSFGSLCWVSKSSSFQVSWPQGLHNELDLNSQWAWMRPELYITSTYSKHQLPIYCGTHNWLCVQ